MILSKYNRNCVLTGPLDGYCLVCENHMRNEEDYSIHLEKPIHKKNLEAAPYFDKYKDDLIRKVKKGYYCEFCNLLFFTATKVGLHVLESQHITNKHTHIRRFNNNIFAFNDVLIENKAWNGFVDNTCIICNTEFDNEGIHLTEQSHTINLIQKPITFGLGESVFRKTDENSFQCLICNLLLGMDQYESHYNDDSHKDIVIKCRKAGQKILTEKPGLNGEATTEPPKKCAPVPEEVKEPAEPKSNINESVKQKSNVENQTSTNKNASADIKKTNETISRDNVKNPIEMDKHICNILGAKDYIIYNFNNMGDSMCLICDWALQNQGVAIHLSSRHHKTMLRMHKNRLQRMTKSNDDLIKEEKSNYAKTNKENIPAADNNKNMSAADDEKNKILDNLQEFQKNYININFEVALASCKKCLKNLTFEFDAINNHIQEHNKKSKKENKNVPSQSVSKERVSNAALSSKPVVKNNEVAPLPKDIEEFAKKHDLKCSKGKITCQLCGTGLSVSLKSLKEHVDGAQHKSKAKTLVPSVSSLKSQTLQKLPFQEFVKSMICVENLLLNEVIINEMYIVNMLSFFTFTLEGDVFKCQICEKVLQFHETDGHKIAPGHEDLMLNTKVITSMEGEFIREPRPGVFHCGFCSEVRDSWEALISHLSTTSHKESRMSAEWRLQQYSSDIKKHVWQKQMEQNIMNFLYQKLTE